MERSLKPRKKVKAFGRKAIEFIFSYISLKVLFAFFHVVLNYTNCTGVELDSFFGRLDHKPA